MMTENMIPVIQLECNSTSSRHEQGIPRFINKGNIPPGGIHISLPPPTGSPVAHPCYYPGQGGIPNALAHQAPHMSGASFHLEQGDCVQFGIQTDSVVNHANMATSSVGNRIIQDSKTPPSPSPSSSSVSIYEDCMSLPPSSPQNVHETFTQNVQPDFFHMSINRQPNNSMSFAMKSPSLSSLHTTSSTNSLSSQAQGHHLPGHGQDQSIRPGQALAMVNEKLRDRIKNLEKKLHRATTEVTFLGDRNWRLEAYLDCLMHTLEIMDVSDVEDLTGKVLPLPMFRVKIKAGYRLGPFNRLPRRTVWSHEESSTDPPNIDLSGDRARTVLPGEDSLNGDDEDDCDLPAGSDIGLSVRQMFHYEKQIEELIDQNHTLVAKLEEMANNLNTQQQANHSKSGENVEHTAEMQDNMQHCQQNVNDQGNHHHGPPPQYDFPHDHGIQMDHRSRDRQHQWMNHPHHPSDADFHHRRREANRTTPYFRRSRSFGFSGGRGSRNGGYSS